MINTVAEDPANIGKAVNDAWGTLEPCAEVNGLKPMIVVNHDPGDLPQLRRRTFWTAAFEISNPVFTQ